MKFIAVVAAFLSMAVVGLAAPTPVTDGTFKHIAWFYHLY
jgi:hypothetical protein